MWRRCSEDVSTMRIWEENQCARVLQRVETKRNRLLKKWKHGGRQVSYVLEENVEYREDVVFETNMQQLINIIDPIWVNGLPAIYLLYLVNIVSYLFILLHLLFRQLFSHIGQNGPTNFPETQFPIYRRRVQALVRVCVLSNI